MTSVTADAVEAALSTVEDPEIRRPITELGMVDEVTIGAGGEVAIRVLLTVSGCPMRSEIVDRVSRAVTAVPGVTSVDVSLGVMTDDQRQKMREGLRGAGRDIVFNRPGNLTRVYAIASGKGGVGKSSITVNLAAALAARGLSVGLLDADIYGHSVPRMLGLDRPPTVVDGMLLPPEKHGVRAISMLPFKPGGSAEPVAFRGPMLHRALEQFLTDVWWGDLDILLLDLPPGTGDVAISSVQLLPQSELLVVTTPQTASAEVAVRAGMLATQTKQRVAGVIENMSAFACPHCGEPIDMFGVGGGDTVAATLSQALGSTVPLLGRVPFDPRLREGGDDGRPLVVTDPEAAASTAIAGVADHLAAKRRGLAGLDLGVTPAGR